MGSQRSDMPWRSLTIRASSAGGTGRTRAVRRSHAPHPFRGGVRSPSASAAARRPRETVRRGQHGGTIASRLRKANGSSADRVHPSHRVGPGFGSGASRGRCRQAPHAAIEPSPLSLRRRGARRRKRLMRANDCGARPRSLRSRSRAANRASLRFGARPTRWDGVVRAAASRPLAAADLRPWARVRRSDSVAP